MPTRQNRYFNNPQMAGAFSNLAGLFAPPSAQDFYMQSRTEGQDFENQMRQELFSAAGGDFDRMGMAAGQWNPNQSFYSVDQGNAVARRGQDIGAQTARRGQDVGLAQAYATNNLTGEQAIPGLPPEIAEALGLGFDLPAVSGQQIGAPRAPMSETQVRGANLQEQLGGIPGLAEALATDGVSGTNVVTDEGVRIMPSGQAALQGAEPFINRGAEAKPEAITFMRGGQRLGGFVVDGQFLDSTGAPLAPEETGTVARIGQPQGSNEDLGLTTTGQNRADTAFINSTRSLEILNELDQSLAENPGSAGLAGGLQRITQNLVQTVDEVGQLLGSGFSPEDLVDNGFIDSETYNRHFNPSLAEQDILFNQLVWAYAAGQQNDGRVSNQQMEQARRSLGIDGALSNTAQIRAALSRLRGQFERDRASAGSLANPNIVQAYSADVRGGPRASQPAQQGPTPGTVEEGFRFLGGDPADPASWEPVQ